MLFSNEKSKPLLLPPATLWLSIHSNVWCLLNSGSMRSVNAVISPSDNSAASHSLLTKSARIPPSSTGGGMNC